MADGGDLDAPDGAIFVSGQVCLVTDMRFPSVCPDVDMGGLTIKHQASSATTTTAADGTFSLPIDTTSTRVVLEVAFGATGVEPALLPVPITSEGASNVLVPVVDSESFADLLTALAVTEPANTANIAMYLFEDGDIAVGAELTLFPGGTQYPPFYDNGAQLNWQSGGLTGTAGAVLLFGVPTDIPFVEVTATNNSGSLLTTFTGIPVATGVTTFVAAELAD